MLNIEEVPGAVNFVRNLATYGLAKHLAIATTATRSEVDIFLEKYALFGLFPNEHLITTENTTRAKPDPEPFDKAFKSLELTEAARPFVLAFEDNPRGIQSINNAGLYACAITTRYSATDLAAGDYRPQVIADSYAQFAESLGIGA